MAPLACIETAAARRPSTRRDDEPIYLGVRLPQELFRRLMSEVFGRGYGLDEGVARALVEGWLAPDTIVVREPSRPTRALSTGTKGGRARHE